jgi:hypothetical protein
MLMHPAVVTDSEPASWRPGRDEPLPPVAVTDARLHEAARFVISPDGHADDAKKILRRQAAHDELVREPFQRAT